MTFGAVSAYHDTLTYDEPAHLEFGERLLSGSLNHADMQKMPATALNALPRRALQVLGVSISADAATWVCRLPTMICATALGWFVFLWSRRLYGAKGGLLSLFVFVFCPTSIGHGRLITTDMYCAFFSFVAAFAFSGYLKTRSWRRLLIAAVLMGAAQLTKHTALLLFPVFLMVFVLRTYKTRRPDRGEARQSWRQQIPGDALRGLVYLLIIIAIINAGYGCKGTFENLGTHRKWVASSQGQMAPAPGPGGLAKNLSAAAWAIPLPLPRAYVEAFILGQIYNETGGGHGPIYLFGHRSRFGWPYYFLAAFLLKMPLPTLGLLAVSVVACARTRRLRFDSDEVLLVGPPLALFAYFSLLCTAQIGIRYLLPLLPFLYVFVGQVGVWVPGSGRKQLRACLLALCLWLPVSVLSYFPHYISYFNEICWDRLHLYQYLADSNLDWGQDGYYLDRYLRAHRDQPIVTNPESRTTGTVIVSVNNLVGVIAAPATYQWLRENYEPTSRIGYSWLVYEIPSRPRE